MKAAIIAGCVVLSVPFLCAAPGAHATEPVMIVQCGEKLVEVYKDRFVESKTHRRLLALADEVIE